jgi:hypothetical protein
MTLSDSRRLRDSAILRSPTTHALLSPCGRYLPLVQLHKHSPLAKAIRCKQILEHALHSPVQNVHGELADSITPREQCTR